MISMIIFAMEIFENVLFKKKPDWDSPTPKNTLWETNGVPHLVKCLILYPFFSPFPPSLSLFITFVICPVHCARFWGGFESVRLGEGQSLK